MDRYPYILGCLLGTALGDAVGIRREGLSRQRATRLYGGQPLRPDLIFGRGFCSDDTEHTQIVGRALVMSGRDAAGFERELARQLKRWFLTLPPGIGSATTRACIRLLMGFRPDRSGVFSAGNGPAMRTALIGVCAESDGEMTELVHRCTRVTHTDPKAEEAALLVARASRLRVNGAGSEPLDALKLFAENVAGAELNETLIHAVSALIDRKTPQEFAASQGWSEGVSGYVNHSVPAALYCWAYSPNDFRRCVENAVLLGGDSDSVAAIAGAICGANLGSEALPTDWLQRLWEWPRTLRWMEDLAGCLAGRPTNNGRREPPSMYWLATIPRNLLFTAVVMGHGFRRLLPPY